MNHLGVFRSGPVQKTSPIQILFSFRYPVCDLWNESLQITLLVSQIVQITLVQVVVPVDNDPPEGVGGDAIHPSGQWGSIPGKVKTLCDHLVITKDAVDGHHFGVHVTHPDKPVPFDTVPQVILHVQMYGICTCLPYLIESVITRSERSQLGDIAIPGYCPHRPDGQLHSFIQQIYPDKPKT